MAEFSRKELKKIFEAAEIEVPKDVLGQLCDLHTESSEDVGSTIKDLKKQLATAENERDEALKKVPADGEETVTKSAYDDLKTQFDTYKAEAEKKETDRQKKDAVRELLKTAGIPDKRLDTVLRVYDLDGIELDDEGKVKDAADRTKSIKNEWADFIPKHKQKGADVDNPPDGNGKGGMSKEDIVKIKDPVERRKAIAENMDLFEKGNDE